MKSLHYLLGAIILLSGIDVIKSCPRCRRALSKGPRKHPHPGFPKKDTHQNSSQNNSNDNSPKSDIKENVYEQK